MEFDSSIDKFSFYWFILFVLQIGAAAGLFPTPMLLDVYLIWDSVVLRLSFTRIVKINHASLEQEHNSHNLVRLNKI